jgi:hypothetical protein
VLDPQSSLLACFNANDSTKNFVTMFGTAFHLTKPINQTADPAILLQGSIYATMTAIPSEKIVIHVSFLDACSVATRHKQ